MDNSSKPSVVFVADAHFHLQPDPAEQRRVERFEAFLELVAGIPHLVLLGDVFDFWFDYPHFRLKGYDAILNKLDRVRAAGTQLHFVGGNHDIWAAGYLSERYGSEASGEPLRLEVDGLRILATHGDGMLGRDWLYRTFRFVVRTRAAIVLANVLHPEILFAFTSWLSARSRAATREEAAEIETKAERWLARQRDPGWDLLVMGHVHYPQVVEIDGRHLASLGGWLDPLGYGVVRDGRFSLVEFPAAGDATF